jgi:predicted transcriptional regulator
MLALRKFFGISRAKMAAAFEISETTLASYEKGFTRVPVVYLLYLELLAQRNVDAERIYAKLASAQEAIGSNRLAARAVIDKKPWETQAIAEARVAVRDANSVLTANLHKGNESESE